MLPGTLWFVHFLFYYGLINQALVAVELKYVYG